MLGKQLIQRTGALLQLPQGLKLAACARSRFFSSNGSADITTGPFAGALEQHAAQSEEYLKKLEEVGIYAAEMLLLITFICLVCCWLAVPRTICPKSRDQTRPTISAGKHNSMRVRSKKPV